MSHLMCREIDEFLVGTYRSYIEDDGVSCCISSSVSDIFVDFYAVYDIFYLFVLIAIIMDKLHHFTEYFGIIIFLYISDGSLKNYFIADFYRIAEGFQICCSACCKMSCFPLYVRIYLQIGLFQILIVFCNICLYILYRAW